MVITYKAIYVSNRDLLHMYDAGRSLSSSNKGLQAVPCTRLKKCGTLWSTLPHDLRAAASADIFKNQLKMCLSGKHLMNHIVDCIPMYF